MLNLKQLETFYWTAKLRSFTAAAKRLGMTQSAISVRINELETSLLTEVFDRSRHFPRMTVKGRELLRYAEQILRLCDEAETNVSNAAPAPDVIRLGFAEIISMTWLPKLVRAIHERYPLTRLELHEALAEELYGSLKQGKIDLVLGAGWPQDARVDATSLGSAQFEWMASPQLGLPKRKLRPDDLRKWPVIALAKESAHFKTIEDWFLRGGSERRNFDTCKSLNVASTLAKGGLGITLLPLRCFKPDLARKKLVLVQTNPRLPAIEFHAFSSADNIDNTFREISQLAAAISDFKK